MFPKSNINYPFPYTADELLQQSFTYDHHHHQNPNSTSIVELDHPFFLNFPSPFLDVHEFPLSQIFSQGIEASHDPDTLEADFGKAKGNHSADISRSMEDKSSNPGKRIPIEPASPSSKKRKLSAKPRRRSGKKDRHSKICTAQGVRDRRMRLSLQIARKFFDLQDMLGFDKASKTIEWLFSKSKNAIKELSRNNTAQENKIYNSISNSEGKKESQFEVKEKDHRKLRKMEIIGAKARESTKEKMMIKCHKKDKEVCETNPQNVESNSYNKHSTQSLENQFANVDIMESYLGGANCSSVTSIFDNYQNNSDNCFMGLLENWDIQYSTTSCSTMINEVQIPFAGSPSSIYLDNSRFEFQHQG